MMANPARRLRPGLVVIVCAAVIAVSLNIIADVWLRSARLDLTEERLYTLTPATRTVLKGLDEPIRLQLYFSDGLAGRSPAFSRHFERVRTLLGRYVELSSGMLHLEVHRLESFTDREDRALAAGLRGVPLSGAGETGFFGLVAANSTDDEAAITFFALDREPLLEYDLTKLIHTLANPRRPVVGLLSALPVAGGAETRPWMIHAHMSDIFEVRALAPDTSHISEDVDVLMLVHPAGLTDAARYAADQFALSGGPVLAFVDPLAETASLGEGPVAGGSAAAGAAEAAGLLEAWGLRMDPAHVVANMDAGRRVTGQRGGRAVVTEYIVWLGIDRDSLNREDPLTAQAELINLATAGALGPAEGAAVSVTPLITTSPRSMTVPAGQVRRGADPLSLIRNFRSQDTAYVLAARVAGNIATAFPEGPPPAVRAARKKALAAGQGAADHLVASQRRFNAVVVADADMLFDEFWVGASQMGGETVAVPRSDNGAFVVNALDDLAGSGTLIGLRSRGQMARPFHVFAELQRDAERRYRAKETELVTKLETVERDLRRLQGSGGEETASTGGPLLSAEDRTRIARFRGEMLALRRDLREVKRALREDIESLATMLAFVNVAAVPLVLLGLAGAIAAVRLHARRRAARRSEEGTTA